MGAKTGHKVSKETREKIRKTLTGRKLSKEHKETIGRTHRKNPVRYFLGKKLSKKHRKNISKALKGGNKTSFKKGEHPSLKTEFKKGQIPWNWKNGRRITTRGYILIFKPNHPFAQKSTGFIMEHRLVMEKHLGRYLKKREVVHHKNSNFSDNRIENLILFNNHSEHISFHERHHNRFGRFV